MNGAASSAPQSNHRSLWHYLQRVPADEALLRAIEARLVDALELQGRTLDLRDDFGRITLPSRKSLPSRPEDSGKFHQVIMPLNGDELDEFGSYLISIADATEADARIILLVSGHGGDPQPILEDRIRGLGVERWTTYFGPQAQAVAQQLASPWPQVWQTVTGHYVPLPWKRFLEPKRAWLQPLVDQPTQTDGNCLLLVLSTSEESKALPAAEPLTFEQTATSHPAAPAAIDEAPPEPVVRQEPPQAPAPQSYNVAIPTLLIAAIGLTAVAQMMMRSQPDLGGYGAIPWLLGLLALGAATWMGRGASGFGRNRPTFDQATLTRGGVYAIALLMSLLAAAQSSAIWVALPLWLLAIILATYALFQLAQSAPATDSVQMPKAGFHGEQLLTLTAIAIIALLLRLWQLTSHPWMLNGIETQLGLEALELSSLFGVNWLTNPNLPLFLTKGSIAVFGRTPLALRILSPFIGTATVLAIGYLGTRLWNRRVGTLAALLLAFSHTHIHYSRLGMTNIWDPLLTLLAIGGCAIAWRSKRRWDWLLAAVAIGLSAYVFTALRLLPLMLLLLLLLMWVIDSAEFKRQLPNILITAGLALVIAAPQIRFFQENPHLFMERANVLGIFQNGWLEREIELTGDSSSIILGRQLWQSAISYNGLLDRDASYNPGRPLVNGIVGILLLIGSGLMLTRLRDVRFAALFSTLTVTLIFAAALLVELPQSRRLLIALPAVMLLASVTADFLLKKAASALPNINWLAATNGFRLATLLLTLVGLLNVSFYFGSYQTSHRFGDRNTEIGFATATYLNTLEGDWTVYFHGPPQVYTTFSTIPFLATEFDAGVNLFDFVADSPPPLAQTSNVAHIFTPDHFDNIPLIQQQLPAGNIQQIEGFHNNPIIVTYATP